MCGACRPRRTMPSETSSGSWSTVDDDQPEHAGHVEGEPQAGEHPEHAAGYAHWHCWWFRPITSEHAFLSPGDASEARWEACPRPLP